MLPSYASTLRAESREAYTEMECIRLEVEIVRAELRRTHSDRSELTERYNDLQLEWDEALQKYMDAQAKFTSCMVALLRSQGVAEHY